jgi:hypothetical protein
MRRRCTECRQMFAAAAAAITTQRVYSAACRCARDRKLGRARRRRRDLDEVREEERERQRASRARRPPASGCHAPLSARKQPLSRAEVSEFVDRALAPSRATLVRDFRGALRRYAANLAKPPALSRGSLGPQVAAVPGDLVAAAAAVVTQESLPSTGRGGLRAAVDPPPTLRPPTASERNPRSGARNLTLSGPG